jgi:UDP-N-acetylmuramoyl-tripeptide--D-alanyl-D-alanine ligase
VADRVRGFVVENPAKQIEVPQWVVPDTTLALGQLAILSRERFDGPLIAVTGSSGKTTVKEMVAGILHRVAPVLATTGNLNNHIGVPKTLLALNQRHRYAVIEMGASAPGEISYLVNLAKPTIAVVTNVLPAHVAGFGSIKGVADAKGEIYSGLDVAGTAILNLDEPWQSRWQENISALKTLTFSVEKTQADVCASDIRLDKLACATFILHIAGHRTTVKLAIPGLHNVSNALAAAACAHATDIELSTIAAGLESVGVVSGRMEYKMGINHSVIIDDSYNANPGSVRAAIDVLASLDGERVLVLGDMAELGSDEVDLHREVGEYARNKNIDRLLVVGDLGVNTVVGFGDRGDHYKNKTTLQDALTKQLHSGVTVLIKGSRSAEMDEVVRKITIEGAA